MKRSTRRTTSSRREKSSQNAESPPRSSSRAVSREKSRRGRSSRRGSRSPSSSGSELRRRRKSPVDRRSDGSLSPAASLSQTTASHLTKTRHHRVHHHRAVVDSGLPQVLGYPQSYLVDMWKDYRTCFRRAPAATGGVQRGPVRGYALSVSKVAGLQLPPALQLGSAEGSALSLRLNLSFFSFLTRSFVGNTLVTEPQEFASTADVVRLHDFAFWSTTIRDVNVVLVAELVVEESSPVSKDGRPPREIALGWTTLGVFGRARHIRDALDSNDRATDAFKDAPFLPGSPQVLLHLESPEHLDKVAVGRRISASLQWRVDTFEALLDASPVLPEDTLVGSRTPVPGLRPVRVAKGALGPCLATQPKSSGRKAKPLTVSKPKLEPEMQLRLDGVQVKVPDGLEETILGGVEEALASKIGIGRFAPAAPSNPRDPRTARFGELRQSRASATVVRRWIRVSIDSGIAKLGTPVEIELTSGGDVADDATSPDASTAANGSEASQAQDSAERDASSARKSRGKKSGKRGAASLLVPADSRRQDILDGYRQHPLVAIAFELMYEVEVKSRPHKASQRRVISVGSSIFVPCRGDVLYFRNTGPVAPGETPRDVGIRLPLVHGDEAYSTGMVFTSPTADTPTLEVENLVNIEDETIGATVDEGLLNPIVLAEEGGTASQREPDAKQHRKNRSRSKSKAAARETEKRQRKKEAARRKRERERARAEKANAEKAKRKEEKKKRRAERAARRKEAEEAMQHDDESSEEDGAVAKKALAAAQRELAEAEEAVEDAERSAARTEAAEKAVQDEIEDAARAVQAAQAKVDAAQAELDAHLAAGPAKRSRPRLRSEKRFSKIRRRRRKAPSTELPRNESDDESLTHLPQRPPTPPSDSLFARALNATLAPGPGQTSASTGVGADTDAGAAGANDTAPISAVSGTNTRSQALTRAERARLAEAGYDPADGIVVPEPSRQQKRTAQSQRALEPGARAYDVMLESRDSLPRHRISLHFAAIRWVPIKGGTPPPPELEAAQGDGRQGGDDALLTDPRRGARWSGGEESKRESRGSADTRTNASMPGTRRVFFTFHFYRLAPHRTPPLALVRDPGAAKSQTNPSASGETAFLLAKDTPRGRAQGTPPDPVVLDVDTSLIAAWEAEDFARYLHTGVLIVDVWDADSQMQIGSAGVQLRSLMRQGTPAADLAREIDVVAPDAAVLSDGGPPCAGFLPRGTVVAGLQILMCNRGARGDGPLLKPDAFPGSGGVPLSFREGPVHSKREFAVGQSVGGAEATTLTKFADPASQQSLAAASAARLAVALRSNPNGASMSGRAPDSGTHSDGYSAPIPGTVAAGTASGSVRQRVRVGSMAEASPALADLIARSEAASSLAPSSTVRRARAGAMALTLEDVRGLGHRFAARSVRPESGAPPVDWRRFLEWARQGARTVVEDETLVSGIKKMVAGFAIEAEDPTGGSPQESRDLDGADRGARSARALRSVLERVERNERGCIRLRALRSAARDAGVELSPEEQAALCRAGRGGDGWIDVEAVAAAMEVGGRAAAAGSRGSLDAEAVATAHRALRRRVLESATGKNASGSEDEEAARGFREQVVVEFQKLDTNGDGWLSVEELLRGLEGCGVKATESEVRTLMTGFMDTNGDGAVNVWEFVRLVLDSPNAHAAVAATERKVCAAVAARDAGPPESRPDALFARLAASEAGAGSGYGRGESSDPQLPGMVSLPSFQLALTSLGLSVMDASGEVVVGGAGMDTTSIRASVSSRQALRARQLASSAPRSSLLAVGPGAVGSLLAPRLGVSAVPASLAEQQRRLDLVRLFRERQKQEQAARVVQRAAAREVRLFPEFGRACFFEITVSNPFPFDDRVRIAWHDPELQLVTDAAQWRYYQRAIPRRAGDPYGHVEAGLARLVAQSEEEGEDALAAASFDIALGPGEAVSVPFVFLSFASGALPFDPRDAPALCLPSGPDTAKARRGESRNGEGKRGAVEEDPVSDDGARGGNPRLWAVPGAEGVLPITARTIPVAFSSQSQQRPVLSLRVHITPRPFLVHRHLRFFQAANTIAARTLRIGGGAQGLHAPDAGDDGPVSRRFVHCPDRSVVAEWRPVDGGRAQEVRLRTRCGSFPERHTFMVAVYADPFHAALDEVWRVDVHAVMRLDLSGVVGQTSCADLLIQGAREAISVQCHASVPHAVRFLPSGPFHLVPNSSNRCRLGVRPMAPGRQQVLLQAVDVLEGRLVAAWIATVSAQPPTVSQTFDVTVPANGIAKKRIEFVNQWDVPRRFRVLAASPAVVEVRSEVMELRPRETGHIRVVVHGSPPGGRVDPVMLFVNDENDQLEECMVLNVRMER